MSLYPPIFILYFDFSLSSFLYLRFAPFQFFSFLSSLFPFHPSLHISIFRTDVPRLTSRCNRSNSLIARVDFPLESKSDIFHPAYTIQIIVDLLFPPWLRRASRRAFISRERRLRDRSRTTTLFSSVIAVTRLCSF